MTEATTPLIKDWSGASGESWVANQVRLDRMLKSFGDAAIAAAAVQRGERVVDIGCGAGSTSFALAEQVGSDGYVLGVDISAQLIARAQADLRNDATVRFLLADAAAIDLPQASFDLLFSRFGVMFFDDPTAAFRHMRRALKPGGRLAFVCWRAAQANDWVRLPMAAISDIVSPTPVDPTAPGPFSFANRGHVETILADVGFTNVAIAPFDDAIVYGDGETRAKAVEDALGLAIAVGPLARALADQPDDIRARATAAVRALFSKLPGETSVLIDAAAWIVTARNPVT